MKLVLASASPRRTELLSQIRLPHEVIPADIDESQLPGEAGDQYVQRLARQKAQTVHSMRPDANSWVLGCDTIVEIRGRLLGKPQNEQLARDMLSQLSGCEHQVLTGVWVQHGQQGEGICVRASVRFRDLPAAEIDRYVATGEPLDKAGAYGIQGIGGIFVEEVVGSFTAIVGLPINETEQLLQKLGLNTWHLRQTH